MYQHQPYYLIRKPVQQGDFSCSILHNSQHLDLKLELYCLLVSGLPIRASFCCHRYLERCWALIEKDGIWPQVRHKWWLFFRFLPGYRIKCILIAWFKNCWESPLAIPFNDLTLSAIGAKFLSIVKHLWKCQSSRLATIWRHRFQGLSYRIFFSMMYSCTKCLPNWWL